MKKNKVRVSLVLDKEVVEWLKNKAKAEGASPSMVVDAITYTMMVAEAHQNTVLSRITRPNITNAAGDMVN